MSKGGWAHAVYGGEMPGYPLLSTAAQVHETCQKRALLGFLPNATHPTPSRDSFRTER